MCFHKYGKSVIIPNTKTKPHETIFQKLGGISIRSVVALSKRENTNTDTARELITIIGIFLLFASAALEPNIIGRSGKTQGANTVSIPEKKAMSKSIIDFYCYYSLSESSHFIKKEKSYFFAASFL